MAKDVSLTAYALREVRYERLRDLSNRGTHTTTEPSRTATA